MKLMIMRHGDALPAVTTDFKRPLSPKGRQQAQDAVGSLVKKNVQPTVMFVSPLLRAQQTSELVTQGLAPLVTETVEALSPESSPVEVVKMLAQQTAEEIILVSHQPLVSRLIALLTGDQIFLDTANVACVELAFLNTSNLQQGELLWVI